MAGKGTLYFGVVFSILCLPRPGLAGCFDKGDDSLLEKSPVIDIIRINSDQPKDSNPSEGTQPSDPVTCPIAAWWLRNFLINFYMTCFKKPSGQDEYVLFLLTQSENGDMIVFAGFKTEFCDSKKLSNSITLVNIERDSQTITILVRFSKGECKQYEIIGDEIINEGNCPVKCKDPLGGRKYTNGWMDISRMELERIMTEKRNKCSKPHRTVPVTHGVTRGAKQQAVQDGASNAALFEGIAAIVEACFVICK